MLYEVITRPAAQGGRVALLHRRVEGVHVDMDDLALRPVGHAANSWNNERTLSPERRVAKLWGRLRGGLGRSISCLTAPREAAIPKGMNHVVQIV